MIDRQPTILIDGKVCGVWPARLIGQAKEAAKDAQQDGEEVRLVWMSEAEREAIAKSR